MKSNDITAKFKKIFLQFPLVPDYVTEPSLTLSEIDYKNIFDQQWLLNRLNSDGMVPEEDRSARDDALFFIYNNVGHTLAKTLERLLYRPLDSSLRERSEHYLRHPNQIWSKFDPIDTKMPDKLLPKYSRNKINPRMFPIDELPLHHHHCSTYEVDLYCERLALKSILELCLITDPKNIFDYKQLLIDIFNPNKFAEALSIQPALAMTNQGKIYLSICNYRKDFPKASKPTTNQKIRKQTENKGLPTKTVDLIALRRLLIIRAMLPDLTRFDFTFPVFLNAFLGAYQDGQMSKYDELMPSERTLAPWLISIWGERKR